ncbi:MAG: alpha/beta fold hydrolase [Betaproteobacteria bacterium]|nr:alpha/beta fold hydrolase [Betaproteobacteria bacterium]
MASETPTWIDHFPGNFMWSNATLVTKGMAPYGAVALGEIDAVCERLRRRQHEPQAWGEEWSAMGARLEQAAQAAEAQGNGMSAGNLFLRAGMYYFTAERFIVPGPEKREMGRKAIGCQTRGILRRYPNVERVEVPYEGTTLPALFMKATGATGRAPTMVAFDGLDNCKEMSVLFNGLEFAARGWHTLAIDGPGQGESLRLRDIRTRHDYEVAGTAAYEWVAARPEVDARKVAVMGYSFGGYYAPRVVAFEKRYCACVAFGAMHWNMAEWVDGIRRAVATDAKTSAQSHFQVPWAFGAKDLDEAVGMAKRFDLAGVAGRIECPLLVAHGENDRIVPLDSARKLYDAAGSKHKTLKIFTGAEGAAEHCQVDNRQLGVDAIADWLAPIFEERDK